VSGDEQSTKLTLDLSKVRDCSPILSRAASASDSVDVADDALGEVVVDDQIDSFEINASSHKIRANQDPRHTLPKISNDFVALALRSIRVYHIDIDALVQQLLEAARGRQRQQIKKIRVGALQLLSALLRLHENENGWAAAGLQKSANGNELSLLVTAIHELLVYIGCGGKTRTDCDVHGIVHDRINDFQRFLGHCSAEQCFLKRGAGAGEHMQGHVRESGSVRCEAWVVQWHQAARRSCGGMSGQQLMTRHEHAPVIKQSVSLVDDEVLHGGQIHAALFDQGDESLGQDVNCAAKGRKWTGKERIA
jgi:hypothetical protein